MGRRYKNDTLWEEDDADQFALTGAKIGYTVNVRRPPRYIGTTGPALSIEDTNETYVPVTLSTQFHVDVQFTTADMATSVDLFKERVLNPVIARVANKIDNDGTTFAYQATANAVGTPGGGISTTLTPLTAGAILDSEAFPRDGTRVLLLDPFAHANMVNTVQGLFNPQREISEFTEKGLVAKDFLGFNWYMDQNIVSYTVGAGGGTPTLANNTSSAWLSSGWAANGLIQTTGWTAAAAARLNIGDVITVAGAYAANPQSRQSVGPNRLRQFVVIAPQATLANGTYANGVYSSTATGLLDIWVSEAGIYAGQFQNITAQPASGAAIQIWGSSTSTTYAKVVTPQGIAMHRDAFALAFADLDLPGGVDMAARAVDEEDGMSFRIVRQYTINNDALPARCDVLYGYGSLYRNAAVRVAS
ncbi:MAG: hypothetical protein KGL39_13895 [Patescibacteria group bacterium]|nr:hypothetical protein [Patescibacteria group bacterium]